MVDQVMPALSDRLQAAWARFDAENAADPNAELVAGVATPKELAHARWLTEWVRKLAPAASEPLLLAARCQHLCRWMIPRESFPMTRAGYLRWRTELKKFHADRAAAILGEVGYSEGIIARVRSLNLKENFPHDLDSQVLEDALCLVFLEHQFAELARKTPDEKMIQILRKTWGKLSPAGQEHARKLSLGSHEQSLLQRAL